MPNDVVGIQAQVRSVADPGRSGPGRQAGEAYEIALPGGFAISDARERLDMDFVHRSLSGAYWARGRARSLTDRSWANSLCLGIYAADGAQVGFGRVLTDYAVRAHIADVFVRPEVRGAGLGKSLVATILSHPELATVDRWTLTTADAQGLYAAFGFRAAAPDGTWLTLDRRPPVGADPEDPGARR